ncbi:MAG: hypothetical protein ACJ735_06615 [Actinomycetes bacterium]
MRRRRPAEYRRALDLEAARIRRRDAVDWLADAATHLAAVRAHAHVDAVELVVAESRVDTARRRFWAADAELRALQPAESRSA